MLLGYDTEQVNPMTNPKSPLAMSPPVALPAWKALGEHYEKTRKLHLRSLFDGDPQRGERLAAEGAGIYLDYSKNRITD